MHVFGKEACTLKQEMLPFTPLKFFSNIGQNGSLKCMSIHKHPCLEPPTLPETPPEGLSQSLAKFLPVTFSGMRAWNTGRFLSSSGGNCVCFLSPLVLPWYYLQIGLLSHFCAPSLQNSALLTSQVSAQTSCPSRFLLNPPGDVGIVLPEFCASLFLVCVTTVALKVVVNMFVYSTWGQCPLSQ